MRTFLSFKKTSTSKPEKHFELLDDLAIAPRWQVDYKAITFSKHLGAGAFGSVCKCTVAGWGDKEIVAKRVQPQRLKPIDAEMIRVEIYLSTLLTHPNTVKFLGISADPKELCLLSEFCDGGTLEDLHDRQGRSVPPKEAQMVDHMHQIASGMAHVHALGYMHRDLKPANVLLSGGQLKIGDFGLACVAPKSPANLTAETGSYRWMAPEVMRHEPYNQLCDVYSFSLVAWEICTHDLPFYDCLPVEAAFAVAKQGSRPAMPEVIPSPIAALIRRCWAQWFPERPSFEEIAHTLDELRSQPFGQSSPCTPSTVAGSRCETPTQLEQPSQTPRPQATAAPAAAKCTTIPVTINESTSLAPAGSAPAQPTSLFVSLAGAPAAEPTNAPSMAPPASFDGTVRLMLFDQPQSSWRNRQSTPSPTSDDQENFTHSPKGERKRLLVAEEDTEYNEAKISASPKLRHISRGPSISTGLDTLNFEAADDLS